MEAAYSYNSRNSYLLGSVTRGGVSNYYGYNAVNLLTSIYHNGFNYNFTYDQWGNRLTTSIQNRLLSQNEYEAANRNLLKTTYGNGDWWSYTYDDLDRVTAKTSENRNAAAYVYNNQDQLVRLTDYLAGNTTEYTHDLLGRLVGSAPTGTIPCGRNTATTTTTGGRARPTLPPAGARLWGGVRPGQPGDEVQPRAVQRGV